MKRKTIVIIGGGFGGIYTAKRLIKLFKKNDYIEIVLINENNYFIFTPMLHEVATGGLNRRSVVEPIREVVKGKNFSFIRDKVKSIDFKKKEIKAGECCINYDFLVIATGAKTTYFNIPGADKYTLSLKTIQDANNIKNHIIEQFEEATKNKAHAHEFLTFVIVGGGPTGVELAGEFADFLRENMKRSYKHLKKFEPRIVLINSGSAVLKHAHKKLQELAYKQLIKEDIDVVLNAKVTRVSKDSVTYNNEKKIKTRSVFWATGVTPNMFKTKPNILTKRGHIEVNSFLMNEKFNKVYALGDCALQLDPKTGRGVPNLAQVAIGQARVVADNIFSRITGSGEMKEYSFKSKGFLVSVGKHFAVAEIMGMRFKGFFAWWLWRTIYLSKLLSFRNKLRTAFDWTIDLFYSKDISEIK